MVADLLSPSASYCLPDGSRAPNPFYDWAAWGIEPPGPWIEQRLGMPLYDWQLEAVTACGQRIPTAITTCNEAGKTTTVIAGFIAWFLDQFAHRGGRAVATSGSWLQVESQLLPALRRFSPFIRGVEIQATQGKVAGSADPCFVSFSTDAPERAEGHHALHPLYAPLLYVIDEAKGVQDGIFTACDRCRPQFMLWASSPGKPSGRFFRTFKERRLRSLFYVRKVPHSECPHIPKEDVEKDRQTYGEESPEFRSMRLAEFTNLEGAVICPDEWLTDCLANPPAFIDGPQVFFLDFAAGGAENVIAARKGNRAWIAAAWRQKDTIQAARRFIKELDALGAFPSQVWGDAEGMGTVMIDALADEDWQINRFNGGDKPQDQNGKYLNAAAEVWFKGAHMIRRKEVILSVDPILAAQLVDRGAEYGPRGTLKNESKDDMAKRGAASPDRADALLGSLVCGHHLLGAISSTKGIRLASTSFARPRAAVKLF